MFDFGQRWQLPPNCYSFVRHETNVLYGNFLLTASLAIYDVISYDFSSSNLTNLNSIVLKYNETELVQTHIQCKLRYISLTMSSVFAVNFPTIYNFI